MTRIQNPDCDGTNCLHESGEVRLLPDGSGNLILCHACYEHEIAFRANRNFKLETVNRFPMPHWGSLKVYL